NINTVKFFKSSPSLNQCPPPDLPEFAFIGRSNVGKSSLINMLCGRKQIAKTSSTPGKTQLINHFLVDEQWYIVDLPGYGYAKVSKKERLKWKHFIDAYLINRPSLQCVLLLIDVRIPAQKSDIEFANWLGEHGIPFVIVFTKSDKLKAGKLKENLQSIK
ncbi:UNVERIFIED_CONTAM: hypothetical protein GTU68_051665, partial [Idotea baltica]|nr:hypothetical protein [Idotea baltica]